MAPNAVLNTPVPMATASKNPNVAKLNPAENFMLAGISAGISKTVAAPIERIKLLLQNQGDAKGIEKPYKGILDIIKRVPAEQGTMSFWRGNMANVYRYFPTQALNFAFKAEYKKMANKALPGKDFASRLLNNVTAGGAAGATSLLVVYPLDFARTRMAMDTGVGADREFKGTLDTIFKTAKTSGWFKGGVYNGFTISAVGIVIYRGLYFGIYDSTRDLVSGDSTGTMQFIKKFTLGYAVTTVAGLAAYPIDTIRRRMMMNSGLAIEDQKYKSSMHAFRLILAEEGVAAYFRGASANIFRGLGGTLVLVGFDYFTEFYADWKYGGK
jgi:solute carrier family 25 (adenine nucleotide translocator) protein 4/5/6/31